MAVRKFIKSTYHSCMNDDTLLEPEISNKLHAELMAFLKESKSRIPNRFRTKIAQVTSDLLEINTEIKKELICELDEKFHHRITDLNSAVMGIPNDTDSDIDIAIAVRTKKEQGDVGKILKKLGYKYDNDPIYDHMSTIPWRTYWKHKGGTFVEVKVRSKSVLDKILIAHKNIKKCFTAKEKLHISFIKSSLLTPANTEYYTKFKYILYGAMFKGDPKTIIFRIRGD